jgi:hypothetical protein
MITEAKYLLCLCTSLMDTLHFRGRLLDLHILYIVTCTGGTRALNDGVLVRMIGFY